MSKAILILDKMPENCLKCQLRFKDGNTDDWFRFRCHMSTDQIPKEGRLGNCLLKPMPKRLDMSKVDGSNLLDLGYMHGRNDLINEMEGEVEE